MASSKEYLEFILGQLSDLEEITYRAMMGEFIIYYRGKIVGGIYDDRLLVNIDKVHTTEMGIDRIKRNLKIDTADVVEYCKNKVLDKNCNIYKQGKNWYCEVENIKITINSYSYTIITAHIVK